MSVVAKDSETWITNAKKLDDTRDLQMPMSKLQTDSKTVGILIALCSIHPPHDSSG
jgi:hypothetical protein